MKGTTDAKGSTVSGAGVNTEGESRANESMEVGRGGRESVRETGRESVRGNEPVSGSESMKESGRGVAGTETTEVVVTAMMSLNGSADDYVYNFD